MGIFNVPCFTFRLFYSNFLLVCMCEQLWMISVAFFMTYFGGMLLVGLSHLFGNILSMCLISYIGNWLDKKDRKYGMLTMLAFHNFGVAVSCGFMAICIILPSEMTISRMVLLFFALTSHAVSNLAATGQRIALTKDWVVVLVKQANKNATLSDTNSTMTIIKQLSFVVSPLLISFMLKYIGYFTSCFILILWFLCVWFIERCVLISIYDDVPELAKRLVRDPQDRKHGRPICTGYMIKTYLSQKVAFASIGLALLYMTVLNFDGVAISYGKTQGLPEDFIGAVRSLTAFIAMSAAVIYRFLVTCIGVRFTGLIGLTIISGSAFVCLISAFLPGSPFGANEYLKELTLETWSENFKNALQKTPINSTATPVYQLIDVDWSTMTVNGKSLLSVLTFFVGLVVARLGYWLSCLCITQQMQETIPSHIRGTVSGVQGSLQSFFSLTKDIMLILLPDPKIFGILILASTFCHVGGLLSYCYYLLQTMPTRKTSNTMKEQQIKLNVKMEAT